MDTQQLIEDFYNSFARGEAKGMVACYAPQVVFEDPVFGQLHGKRAEDMWQMLLSNPQRKVEVTYRIVKHDPDNALVMWTASYLYGPKKRKVINSVQASFDLKDGLIVHHRDNFSLWNWSRQALGWSGWLMGWTNIMERKIQKKTRAVLDTYIAQKASSTQ